MKRNHVLIGTVGSEYDAHFGVEPFDMVLMTAQTKEEIVQFESVGGTDTVFRSSNGHGYLLTGIRTEWVQ